MGVTSAFVHKRSKKTKNKFVHPNKSSRVVDFDTKTKQEPIEVDNRYSYITSSTSFSSTISENCMHLASNLKKYHEETSGSSNDRRNSSKVAKKRKEAPEKSYYPLITRLCQRCNYIWKTHSDLRLHRDSEHPNYSISDLLVIEIKVPKEDSRTKVGNLVGCLIRAASNEKRETKPKLDKRNSNSKRTSLRLKAQKRLSGKGPLSFPKPNTTFSEKETFLHSLGLINTVRLQIHCNKSSANVKLPECFVKLERLK
ncbi:unnamed protein product [Orchesella dallaii]